MCSVTDGASQQSGEPVRRQQRGEQRIVKSRGSHRTAWLSDETRAPQSHLRRRGRSITIVQSPSERCVFSISDSTLLRLKTTALQRRATWGQKSKPNFPLFDPLPLQKLEEGWTKHVSQFSLHLYGFDMVLIGRCCTVWNIRVSTANKTQLKYRRPSDCYRAVE